MRSLIIAAAAAALLASPAMAAKKSSHATGATPTPAAPATPGAQPAKAKKGGSSKLAECRSQWKSMSQADKQKYNDMAKGKTGKKGGKVSGYNVFTSECAKKA